MKRKQDIMIDGEPLEDQRSGGFWRGVRRFFKYFFIVLALALVTAIIFIWYNLSKLSINPLDLGSLAATGGRTNILVLGIGDPGHPGQNLSDTLMVISIDHISGKVALISLPRDLRVPIPGHYSAKINQANALGGPKLAEQTVANTLGMPINYYVKTDFSGLKNLVDDVGGLDITVTSRLSDPEYPCADNENKVCGLDIEPGTYHMNGATVLEYTRCRKGTCGNDFGRAARQQDVIEKLQASIARPRVYLNPTTDAALLTTVRTYSQTDLSVGNMITVGRELHGAPQTIKFVFSTSPGGFLRDIPGSSDLGPTTGNFSAIQAYVQDIFSQPASTN